MKKILFLIIILILFSSNFKIAIFAEESIVTESSENLSTESKESTATYMTFDELQSFYNSPITENIEIENAFYFKKHYMCEIYNTQDTCSIVSLIYLLGYYDTFYNGNILPDEITYTSESGQVITFNPLYNDTFTSNFIYQTWKTTGTNNSQPPSPTKEFHDYLVDIALKEDIIQLLPELDANGNPKYDTLGNPILSCGGMSYLDTDNVLEKYFELNNISSDILEFRNFLFVIHENILLNLLDQGIPLRVSIEDYDYYYSFYNYMNYTPRGLKTENTGHSVLVYGYIKNEYGTFLKADFGYPFETQCYVNIDYVTGYSYYSVTTQHICSNNYHFGYTYNGQEHIIDMCPCRSWDYYFTHTGTEINSSGEEVHKFKPNENENVVLEYEHINISYNNVNTNNHTERCVFYSFCENEEVVEHDILHDSKNFDYSYYFDSGHYYLCDCGYINLGDHSNNQRYDDNLHTYYCLVCSREFYESHSYNFVGTIENHNKICEKCEYEYVGIHQLTYNTYDNINHEINCTCNYNVIYLHNYDEDKICINCGHEHLTHIFYEYNKNGSLNHQKVCYCGYVENEVHTLIDSGIGMRCTLCGYFTTGPVIVVNIPIENEIESFNDVNEYYVLEDTSYNKKGDEVNE